MKKSSVQLHDNSKIAIVKGRPTRINWHSEKRKLGKSGIVEIPITQVVPWDKNPRSITTKDFNRLKKHLTKWGQYKPLICFRENSKYVTLGGNMRLKAMQELGIKQVRVLPVNPKSEKERIELSLIDNDRAGYYEDQQLAELIFPFKDELDLGDFRVDLRMPDVDLGNVLDRYAPSNEKDDEVPEVKETNIKLGDLFQLGKHRLLCGDAIKRGDVKRLMDGKKADMVFTDPPYDIIANRSKGKNKFGAASKGDYAIDKFPELDAWLPNAYSILTSNSAILVFEYWANVVNLWKNMETVGFKISNLIIWCATNRRTSYRRTFYNKYDICVAGAKGNFPIRKQSSMNTYDIISHPVSSIYESEQEVVLGTKPVDILIPYIVALTKRNQIILDMFGGSGSCAIACEKALRSCYLLEIHPLACQVIIDRWQNYTGQKAKRISA